MSLDVGRKLIRKELGERGRAWVREVLGKGLNLSSELLATNDASAGSIYTYLPPHVVPASADLDEMYLSPEVNAASRANATSGIGVYRRVRARQCGAAGRLPGHDSLGMV